MDNYEKNVDKALNAVEKVGGVMNRVYIGCGTILANLFFAGFCLWGAYAGYVSWKLQNEGVTTTGMVVSLDESNTQEGGCCVYSPVVEFDANGRKYTFDGDTASYPPAYKVGEQVPVIYDPADPDTAQINKPLERWLFPILIIPAMLFGALLVNFFMIRAFWRNESIDE